MIHCAGTSEKKLDDDEIKCSYLGRHCSANEMVKTFTFAEDCY
jgi:hypothetical protein